ncbi:MAG TPA: class I SAM-dependent RNA methyltransferase [Ktedonobacterales bacterium]|nr:class I SAM-dependent RNA methyltransferase [Ktedonobacterales bacterium]
MADIVPLQHNAPPDSERRTVAGRYHVRVEALEPNGEARGRVVATLSSPTAADFTAVYGPERGRDFTLDDVRFVGALPGELVEVVVTWSLPRPGRKRAKHPPAPLIHLTGVIEAAEKRVTPPCPVFGRCGGCQLQHMAYPAQLAWKTERVCHALAAAGLAAAPVLPAIGCDDPWRYRNHMRFSVDRDGRAGLTQRGTHRVLPLAACPIAEEGINRVLPLLAARTLPRPQALVRYSPSTREMLMVPPPDDELRAEIAAQGITLCDEAMDEELLGVLFRIRPSSFFQTNSRQANRMAELVLAWLPGGPDTTLVDAYCGVGTFARLLAPRAGRVIAIEESASAIRDARWNLRDTPNVTIVQAKVEDVLPSITERLDGLVIDPPRAGCQRPVLDALAERRVPRVVYVSCDPDTLARDLAYLCETRTAYHLREVQPLDMFPQTAHIENIATLEADV